MVEPCHCAGRQNKGDKAMRNTSKTDWERVKREATADEPIAQEADELYDPNDPVAVEAFFAQATVHVAAKTRD